MTTNTVKIAVLMRPIEHTDKWVTDVVCHNGPVEMLAARTFGQAITAIHNTLNTILTGCRPTPEVVEVWTVMASADVLDWFDTNGQRDLFWRLEAVPADVLDIAHRVIHLTTRTPLSD